MTVQSKKFQRNIEDFVCENCGAKVIGNGYTNHCPNCLYSKHVDVYPGDRSEDCGGMMEPIGLEKKNGQFRIIHRCLKCGEERANKTAPNDNLEILLRK